MKEDDKILGQYDQKELLHQEEIIGKTLEQDIQSKPLQDISPTISMETTNPRMPAKEDDKILQVPQQKELFHQEEVVNKLLKQNNQPIPEMAITCSRMPQKENTEASDLHQNQQKRDSNPTFEKTDNSFIELKKLKTEISPTTSTVTTETDIEKAAENTEAQNNTESQDASKENSSIASMETEKKTEENKFEKGYFKRLIKKQLIPKSKIPESNKNKQTKDDTNQQTDDIKIMREKYFGKIKFQHQDDISEFGNLKSKPNFSNKPWILTEAKTREKYKTPFDIFFEMKKCDVKIQNMTFDSIDTSLIVLPLSITDSIPDSKTDSVKDVTIDKEKINPIVKQKSPTKIIRNRVLAPANINKNPVIPSRLMLKKTNPLPLSVQEDDLDFECEESEEQNTKLVKKGQTPIIFEKEPKDKLILNIFEEQFDNKNLLLEVNKTLTLKATTFENDCRIVWKKDDNVITDGYRFKITAKGKVHSLSIKQTKKMDKGIYSLIAEDNSNGTKQSTSCSVQIGFDDMKFVYSLPNNKEIYEQENAYFNITINHPEGRIYWIKN